MTDKNILMKEVSILQFIFLTTSKLLIGIGIGLIIASHYWYAQPYWYVLIIVGAIILVPTLYKLMRFEGEKESEILKKIKKI